LIDIKLCFFEPCKDNQKVIKGQVKGDGSDQGSVIFYVGDGPQGSLPFAENEDFGRDFYMINCEKRRPIVTRWRTGVLMLFLFYGAGLAQNYEMVTLGLADRRGASALFEDHRAFLQHLTDHVYPGMLRGSFQLRVFPHEEALLEAFSKGSVDFIRVGAANYFRLKLKHDNLKLLAVETLGNVVVQHGILYTQKYNQIQTIEDLKGQAVAFGPEGDALLDLAAKALLFRSGLTGEDIVEKHIDDAVAMAELVDAGRYRAGVYTAPGIGGEALPDILEQELGPRFRVLGAFQAVGPLWVMSGDKFPATLENTQKTLMEMKQPRMLDAFGITGFSELSQEDPALGAFRQALIQALHFHRKKK
jgi:hypothetical protein